MIFLVVITAQTSSIFNTKFNSRLNFLSDTYIPSSGKTHTKADIISLSTVI